MLLVFLSPALLALIGKRVWDLLEHERDMRRMLREFQRGDLNRMGRAGRWVAW